MYVFQVYQFLNFLCIFIIASSPVQTCQPLRSQKCILQLQKVYFSHKKRILQVSPKKTHIIQLLNTKTNTTDVLGNKFYKTQSLFFYLTM